MGGWMMRVEFACLLLFFLLYEVNFSAFPWQKTMRIRSPCFSDFDLFEVLELQLPAVEDLQVES